MYDIVRMIIDIAMTISLLLFVLSSKSIINLLKDQNDMLRESLYSELDRYDEESEKEEEGRL